MTIQKRKKTTVTHVIDGCVYGSANDVAYHEELKANPYVKTFRLPTKKDKQKFSRYGAYKCEINKIEFDSTMEGRFYAHLLECQNDKSNDLKSFEMQVTYTLVPGFTEKFSGKRIRPITYIADFVLNFEDGTQQIIDVKGRKTPEFRIKEKLFMSQHKDVQFLCVQWDAHDKTWRNLDDIEKDKRARKRAAAKKKKAS